MRLFTLLAFLLGFCLTAQDLPADSLKIYQTGRTNAPWAKKAPYLILISADGFRHDYPELHSAQFLSSIRYRGQRAQAMLPSYPSVTGPNHYTLVTGLYPSHHGMVDNAFFDKTRNARYSFGKFDDIRDGSWLGGKPLWGVAERAGMLTASLMWVASDGDAGGTRPTYSFRYAKDVSREQKVNQVVQWLKLPEAERPHLIHLYFPEVDEAGHFYGPSAPETRQAVQAVDASLQSLDQQVAALGLDVRFVFLSDHGMLKVDTDTPLEIPEMLLDQGQYRIFNGQTLLRIEVLDKNKVRPTYQALKKNRSLRYRVTLAQHMPKHLHYSTREDRFDRIGDIFLRPYAPAIFLQKGEKTKIGKHGYDPQEVPEMKAVFMTWKSGAVTNQNPSALLPEFENVEVYPFVLDYLGIKQEEKVDGKGRLIGKIKR